MKNTRTPPNSGQSLSLSTQAKLLARFIAETGLGTLPHSQALEALAHANNFKSFNVLKHQSAAKPTATEPTAEVLLRQAIAKGLSVGDALNVFAESRTQQQSAYLEAARACYSCAGELEFDDNAEVSLSEDAGAYVMGWRWVDKEDLATPSVIVSALRKKFRQVSVLLEGQDTDADFDNEDVTLNDEALAQYAAGTPLAPGTWLARGLNRDEVRFVLKVRHADVLKFNEDTGCFEGKLDGDAMELCFRGA